MTTVLHETQSQIQSRIFTVRGVQVMIDRDLARLYQVQTKVLNQAVKRNINRFPERFMFQLNENEAETLLRSRSQFVTLNEDENMSSQFVTSRVKRGQNLKYLPFAFTEQGVTQLSAVLRSDVAVEMSIRINDAFHAMHNLSLLKIAKVKPDLSNRNPEGHYLQNKPEMVVSGFGMMLSKLGMRSSVDPLLCLCLSFAMPLLFSREIADN